MTGVDGCPDTVAVLSGLKDFQRDTVEYVFRRLYLDRERAGRFLIADEVGLGKTLVARGLVAKTIDHLWDRDEQINVLYICSNGDIARQNITRLNVTGRMDFNLPSRITLLPVTIRDLEKNRLNFISFTPGTSFDLKSSLGWVQERALLYWLLDAAWGLKGVGALNLLEGRTGREKFRAIVRSFKSYNRIDPALADKFRVALERHAWEERAEGREDIRARFQNLCERFTYIRGKPAGVDAVDRRLMVEELRGLLAATCLSALRPNLIILDEFQRFKYLLDGTDGASELAQDLFEYPDARVILLSATPYKMYTMRHESEEEDHYQDFLRTVRFLEPDAGADAGFEALLDEYRRELFRLGGDGGALNRLVEVKRELEARLRRVMVRTERLTATDDRDGMLVYAGAAGAKIEPRDLGSYLTYQRVARALGQGDTLEYWKSAPYLLNFMDEYELKNAFEQALALPGREADLAKELCSGENVLLPWRRIFRYERVDPGNAKLRGLVQDTIGRGAWRLLWIPPSLDYYKPGGPFADPALKSFTKRLVFSSWRVVPKAITALLSYEAERLLMRSYDPAPVNSAEARKRRTPLLRFTRAEERLTGMPVLGIMYPSVALARLCDPLHLRLIAKGGLPSIEELLKAMEARVERALRDILPKGKPSVAEDESWYWAAPLLLDLQADGDRMRQWLFSPWRAQEWSSGPLTEEWYAEASLWSAHVEHARRLVNGQVELGRPPSDLTSVLAKMGIAGPAVSALRALARVAGGIDKVDLNVLRTGAAQVAWSFRHLFNLPESMALIRGLNGAEPYWERVLDYCVDGGLQSTLDEYTHILRESLGLLGSNPEVTVVAVAEAVRESLSLRTATPAVDDIRASAARSSVTRTPRRMRGHFALRFGEDKADEDRGLNRAEHVRAAFNSPFWPFVLSTTSVGQEGLDFHHYCHAVVHWNLPANPVDLEQREGRVHRYKGHAVRKNLARTYGSLLASDADEPDIWTGLFEAARKDRDSASSDLIPFWVFAVDEGARIERYIPALPLSRDLEHYEALRRSLAVYRMVFGQSRQEELTTYLLSRLSGDKVETLSGLLRVNLEPPHRVNVAPPALSRSKLSGAISPPDSGE